MRRPSEPLSRRELIKRYGMAAFLLHPVLRSAAYAAEIPFEKSPRYVLFFKGGSFYPSRTNPKGITIDNFASTPKGPSPLAPLQKYASDLILFQDMNIMSGSPKTDGYKEEHAAGIIGCTTGNSYHYYKNDAYFAYTDNASIDVHIAENYKQRPELKDVPLASLHIGGGAHSDSDSTGVGNRYISFRKRKDGEKDHYANAIEPMQDSGQVYDMLMQAAGNACMAQSNQPRGDARKLNAALASDGGIVDFQREYLMAVKQDLGKNSAEARMIDAIVERNRELEKSVRKQVAASPATSSSSAKQCSPLARPIGNGANKKSLDDLDKVHNQMIDLIKFAFEADITRVVAFTLSGASSGQTWPSQGIHKAHHSLEHNGDVNSLVTIDTYYAQKYAKLLETLKTINDPNGKTALYNSMVLLGMECWSNSSSGHYLKNIPFIMAGQGGGKWETGRIVDARERNNNDLHLSCLRAAGINDQTFGLPGLCQGPII